VKWPLETSPIPDSELPIYNSYYLHACRTPEDPVMIWGTEVEVSKLQDYLRIANRESSFLLTTSHILIRGVAKALEKHPEFNQRVVGKRIYRFKAIHVLMAMQDPREQQAELLLVKDANQRSLSDIAQTIWKHHQDAARGSFTYQKEKQTFRFFPQPIGRWILNFQQFLSNRFHLPETRMCERQRCSPVLVNYLGFRGAPPMKMFKASRFPNESLMMNITMGPSELQPIVQNERVVIRPVAPLFVRADHRTVDAYRIAQFTETLRSYISNPEQMDVQTGTQQPASITKQKSSEAKPSPDAQPDEIKSNTHHTTSSPA